MHYQDVRAGCTKFPTRVSVQPDRELLAVDEAGAGNGTGILTTGCIDVGANSSSCSP